MVSFFTATWMELNHNKSMLLVNEAQDEELERVVEIFPFAWKYIEAGLKYLGFMLKPNSCTFKD
jgi:hypothetical protein